MSEADRPSDFEIVKQWENIKEEQIRETPHIGPKVSIDTLKEEFANATETQKAKVNELSVKYKYIRRVRRDGNCLIRAFAFGLLEFLLSSESVLVESLSESINNHRNQLLIDGFPDLIDDFWEGK